jgi:hypothetical protein
MKTFRTVLITCLALLAAATSAILVWQFHEGKQQTAANAQLTAQLEEAKVTVAALTEEKARLSEKMTSLESLEMELRERVDSLETAAKTADETTPRPYRVRAFMGRENVGDAWIVPHNLQRDPESGRYTFEPVLVIDESSRSFFTAENANVSEREVYTTEIIQETYGYPYYYYVTPGRPGKPGRPPVKPEHPITPTPEEPEWNSQPDPRTQVFAPPMRTVNTRPQVITRPATSPINQKVFAP